MGKKVKTEKEVLQELREEIDRYIEKGKISFEKGEFGEKYIWLGKKKIRIMRDGDYLLIWKFYNKEMDGWFFVVWPEVEGEDWKQTAFVVDRLLEYLG